MVKIDRCGQERPRGLATNVWQRIQNGLRLRRIGPRRPRDLVSAVRYAYASSTPLAVGQDSVTPNLYRTVYSVLAQGRREVLGRERVQFVRVRCGAVRYDGLQPGGCRAGRPVQCGYSTSTVRAEGAAWHSTAHHSTAATQGWRWHGWATCGALLPHLETRAPVSQPRPGQARQGVRRTHGIGH